MEQVLVDLAFLLELGFVAAGLMLLHAGRLRSAGLLRAGGVLVTGGIATALCTGFHCARADLERAQNATEAPGSATTGRAPSTEVVGASRIEKATFRPDSHDIAPRV